MSFKHIGPSRSSKVVDFGTNRKRVCDFLLIINSNLGPILLDIVEFLLRRATPPLFHPNFGAFPLNQIADVVAPRSEDPKLIILVISFELTQHRRPWYTNVTDGQTDGRTDDLRQH